MQEDGINGRVPPIKILPIELTEDDKKRLRFQKFENTLLGLRIAGSIVMCWDVCIKCAYYNFSRFASIGLKQVYLCLLFFRPFMLFLMTLYYILLDCKTYYSEKDRKGKKFKDDIAYQKELAEKNKKQY